MEIKSQTFCTKFIKPFLERDPKTLYVTQGITLHVTHGKYCHKFVPSSQDEIDVEAVHELYCDHEEADTRLLLHAYQASLSQESVVIKSPDTDVFILMVGHKHAIAADLYFDTGSGNNRRIISIQSIYESLGPDLSASLIGFHAFTGCDSTSAFYGKGKTKAFTLLENKPDFVSMFKQLGRSYQVESELFAQLEKYVCHLYNQPTVDEVDFARYNQFKLGQFGEDSMPCTRNVLRQHVKRVVFQARIWWLALEPITATPSITDFGWSVVDGNVNVVWMTLPPAPEGVLENVSCGCKSGCATKRCVCKKADLACTSMCSCTSNCQNLREIDVEGDDDDSGDLAEAEEVVLAAEDEESILSDEE
eukprot:Seg542.2 transcript_id=Seg542.2/GoldUCD/mRNA.D3Y31 product="hypothetical protein" protein_id=Seg542.2/GoldUCD/D3Y31